MATLFQSSTPTPGFNEPKQRSGLGKLFSRKKSKGNIPATIEPPTLPPLDILGIPVESEPLPSTQPQSSAPVVKQHNRYSSNVDEELRRHLKNEGISILALMDFAEPSGSKSARSKAPEPTAQASSASTAAPTPTVPEKSAAEKEAEDRLASVRDFYTRGKKAAPTRVPVPVEKPTAIVPTKVESISPPPPSKEALPALEVTATPPFKKITTSQPPKTDPETPQKVLLAAPKSKGDVPRKAVPAPEPAPETATTVTPKKRNVLSKQKVSEKTAIKPLEKPIEKTQIPNQYHGIPEQLRKSPDSESRDSGKFLDADSIRSSRPSYASASADSLVPPVPIPMKNPRRSTPDLPLRGPDARRPSDQSQIIRNSPQNDGFLKPDMPPRVTSQQSHKSPRHSPPRDMRRPPQGPPSAQYRPNGHGPYGPQPQRNGYFPGPSSTPNLNAHRGFDERSAHPHAASRQSQTRAQSHPEERSSDDSDDVSVHDPRRRTIDFPVPAMLPPQRSYVPAVSNLQRNCADGHQFTVLCANVHHRIACMSCLTDSSPERFLCSYCALRFCGRCKAEFKMGKTIDEIRQLAAEEDWSSQPSTPAIHNSSPGATSNAAWEMASNLESDRPRQPPRLRAPPPPGYRSRQSPPQQINYPHQNKYPHPQHQQPRRNPRPTAYAMNPDSSSSSLEKNSSGEASPNPSRPSSINHDGYDERAMRARRGPSRQGERERGVSRMRGPPGGKRRDMSDIPQGIMIPGLDGIGPAHSMKY